MNKMYEVCRYCGEEIKPKYILESNGSCPYCFSDRVKDTIGEDVLAWKGSPEYHEGVTAVAEFHSILESFMDKPENDGNQKNSPKKYRIKERWSQRQLQFIQYLGIERKHFHLHRAFFNRTEGKEYEAI